MWDDLDATDIVERMPLMVVMLLWIFGRKLNRWIMGPVIARAYERGIIDSKQLHLLALQFDPTQRGVMGRIWLK